tara:strand:+ start:162 stop:734 length:573 start_codon:yes stop_codon:yes gene_type:complete
MSSLNIISSQYQNKEWRLSNICNNKGQKDSSCEKYQREQVEIITKNKCNKTNGLRLNWRKNILDYNKNPMTINKKIIIDGLDWTEDFDGIQEYNDFTLLYNFKFVSGSGGAQTRTIREVSHFIESQLKYLNANLNTKYIFINILDGNVSHERRGHFDYILNMDEYINCKNNCKIFDCYEFNNYFNEELSK